MKEKRCINSGALLFFPSPEDQEKIEIKKENKELKERLEKLEYIVDDLLSNKELK